MRWPSPQAVVLSGHLTTASVGLKVQPMRSRKLPLMHLVQGTLCLTYLSLTVWMHIWALEASFPKPEEASAPHHQVCTWIGTSGEAGITDSGLLLSPQSTVSSYSVPSPSVPVLSVTSFSISARAPPLSS